MEKVQSLRRCCPRTLARGRLSDSARQGYFTRQKSIVHLISKSADMLCVLHYLLLSCFKLKREIWGRFKNSSTYAAAHAQGLSPDKTRCMTAIWIFY